MSWFSIPDEITTLETDELQARLTGLCHKIIAQGHGWSNDMNEYGKIITELTRRNVKPVMTVVPR